MTGPRTSIVWLMSLVSIVALNLAVGQTIFLGEPWRLAGIAPTAIVIQLGLYNLILARGRRRQNAFWAGFEAGALVGLSSFLYARVPESQVAAFWDSYAEFIDAGLREYCGLSVLNRRPLDPLFLTAIAVFAFLPQLLLAVVGGLLSLSSAWSARSRTVMLTLSALLVIPILNVAAWAAAWNALPAQPPWLPFGVTPAGLLLELGVYGLITRWFRPADRAFWIGFLLFVSLVFWSYLHAMILDRVQTAWFFNYWPGGPFYIRPISPAPWWTLWADYTALASYLVGRPPVGTYIVAWTDDLADSLVYLLIVLVPHLLGGLGGAMFAMLVTGKRAGTRPVVSPPSAHPS